MRDLAFGAAGRGEASHREGGRGALESDADGLRGFQVGGYHAHMPLGQCASRGAIDVAGDGADRQSAVEQRVDCCRALLTGCSEDRDRGGEVCGAHRVSFW